MYSQEFALTDTFLKFSSKEIKCMQNHKYIMKGGVQQYWLSRRLLSDVKIFTVLALKDGSTMALQSVNFKR